MREVTVKLQPYEVKTLMRLVCSELLKRTEAILNGKIEKPLIGTIAELKEIYSKLTNQSKERW